MDYTTKAQKHWQPAKDIDGVNRKDYLIHGYKVISSSKRSAEGNAHEIIDLRLSVANNRATVVHACIWIKTPGDWRSGSSSAGGYGYHKPSAAAYSAMYNAGIRFKQSGWGGAGDEAIRSALRSIAKRLGHNSVSVIEMYP